MWPGGVAALIDPEVAANTDITALPLGPDTDLSETTQSPPDPDGHVVMKNGSNTQGVKELLKYMYGRNPDATGQLYDTSPMRFMPNYEGVLGSEAFQSLDYFSEFPGHLDALEWIQNEYVPNYYGNSMDQIPVTGPNMYFERFNIAGRMMHNVLGADMDPQEAYNQARSDAETRLQEGKETFS
jgi:ABC-type glycerol-3-phosphate transport system substrate-binding protein